MLPGATAAPMAARCAFIAAVSACAATGATALPRALHAAPNRERSHSYVLLCALPRLGLAHTHLAAATCGSLSLKLPKIAAWVCVSILRIKIAMDTNHSF